MMEMPEYPELHIDSKQLPAIKEWEVGKTYEVVIKVKQLSKNEMDKSMNMDDKDHISAGFKIVSIKVGNKEKEPSNMNAKEHRSYMAKEMRKISEIR